MNDKEPVKTVGRKGTNRYKAPGRIKAISYLLYLCVIVSVCLYLYKKPEYNWDMLAYMAVVLGYEKGDKDQIHKEVYTVAKEQVPVDDYGLLTDSTIAYRVNMHKSAADFHLQMPFYLVKPLYTGMAYLFYKAGVPLTKATVLPSVIAWFAMTILLFYWLQKYLPLLPAFLLCCSLVITGPFLYIGKLSTPDCLSSFLLLAALYFLLEQKSLILLQVSLLLSIFARLDNIIPCMIILSLLAFTNKWNRKLSSGTCLLMAASALACCLMITFSVKNDNWSLYYYPSFFQHLNPSHDIHAPFDYTGYIKLAATHAWRALNVSYLPFFSLLIILLFADCFSAGRWRFTFDQMLALCFCFIIALRFLLQPAVEDRFYIAYYLGVLILFIRKHYHAPESIHSP